MGPAARSIRVLSGDKSFVRAVAGRISDPKLLGDILAAGKGVVTVAWVEPHFVVTSEVCKSSNDCTASLVNDYGVRVSVGRLSVTAQQYLIVWPDRHSLWRCTQVDGDNKSIHDRLGRWVDDCHAAFTIRMPSDARDRNVEFPGSRTPLALFSAVIGVRCTIGFAIKKYLLNDLERI